MVTFCIMVKAIRYIDHSIASAGKNCYSFRQIGLVKSSRAGLLVEEVQSSLRGGPGQLVDPRCDTLVQIPQPVIEEPALLLVQGSQHLLSHATLKVPS